MECDAERVAISRNGSRLERLRIDDQRPDAPDFRGKPAAIRDDIRRTNAAAAPEDAITHNSAGQRPAVGGENARHDWRTENVTGDSRLPVT